MAWVAHFALCSCPCLSSMFSFMPHFLCFPHVPSGLSEYLVLSVTSMSLCVLLCPLHEPRVTLACPVSSHVPAAGPFVAPFCSFCWSVPPGSSAS